MTKPSDIQDPTYRSAIESADRMIGEGKYYDAVKTCAETYVDLIQKRPDILKPDRQVRPSIWPQLGVKLEATDGPQPRLVWERERFSMSEAAMFLEFAMDQLVRAERSTR
ncbi:MAG TPA: hypothetical protein VH951_08000 [Dehalococcoidia bacterium]|jgi:hypothetical protein